MFELSNIEDCTGSALYMLAINCIPVPGSTIRNQYESLGGAIVFWPSRATCYSYFNTLDATSVIVAFVEVAVYVCRWRQRALLYMHVVEK